MKEEMERWKEETDSVLLAHYYVPKEIQKLADYVGDSFYLASLSKKLRQKQIVMAGVHFMGESIKILNPDKKVVMLHGAADCPMAHMIQKEKIQEMRKKYQDLAVVCYINSTAEIKALSDVCVTSSNAVSIVKNLKEKNIFFIPDGNLARYVASFVPEKNIIANEGYCPVHHQILRKEVLSLKEKYPQAKVLSHPECRQEILNISDFVGSTKQIIQKIKEYMEKEYIIITEMGIAYELEKLYPDKSFYLLPNLSCQDMKYSTSKELLNLFQGPLEEIFLEESIIEKARKPLQRMLDFGEAQ